MQILTQKLKNLTKTDIAAAVCIGISFIFLIILAFVDGTLSDESFYLTIPFRLMNGDGLFTDEWHLSQLSSVLLYIPVKLFYSVTDSTEGIILYMRLLFCLLQLGTGILVYKTLRKYALAAIIAGVSVMQFYVIGINTLSYNTLGLSCLFALICIMYDANEKPSCVRMVLGGTLIAAFILCQPLGLIYYALYFGAVCFFFFRNAGKRQKTPFPFTVKSFLFSVAGILPVLAFFLYLLFRSSDLATIIRCIPGILTDMEHMMIAENVGYETFSVAEFFIDMTMCSGTVTLILFAVCIIVSVLLKKINRNTAYVIAAVSFAVFSLVFWYRIAFMRDRTETDDIYFFFFSLAVPAIAFYLISEKKNSRIFYLFWGTGLIYSVLMTISSNLRLHASVNGYILCSIATLVLAKDAYDELKASSKEDKFAKITAALLCSVIFGFSIFNCAVTVAGPLATRLTYNSAKMTQGIFKGITLPTDQAVIYTRILRDTTEIKEIIAPEDKLLVIENIAAAYLEGEFNMGSPTGWFICEQLQFDEVRDRFREYYEIFPENIPDYIYVPSYRHSTGVSPTHVSPKLHAEYAYSLFEGSSTELFDGILIKVTGIKNE